MRASPLGIAEHRDTVRDYSGLAEVYNRQEGLRELQSEVLPYILGACLGICFLLVAFYCRFSEPQTWVPLWLLLAALGFIYWLRERHLLASKVLVLCLYCVVTALMWLNPGSNLGFVYSLVVLIAGVLLGSREGLLVCLAATAAVTIGAIRQPAVVDFNVMLISVFVCWGTAYLSWLSTHPLHTALEWSWSSYIQALKQTNELRDRQGELVALTKGLAEAYGRLEMLNAELEKARKAADDARRQKTEFATTISHELRTPLNLIVGFSEMMVVKPKQSYDEDLPDSFRGDIEAIYRSACHLSSLIDDVLDLSQIEAHRMPLYKELAPLGGVVNEAVTTVRSLFEDKGLCVSAEVPPDLPPVWHDRGRVRQILINLLANAARFTRTGGATVRAELGEGEVILSVRDTGTGISPEDVEAVFEEFRQIGDRASVSRRTSGLGLAICRRFAELHGGRMWLQSQVGFGSQFSLALPIDDVLPLLPPIPRATGVVLPKQNVQNTLAVLDDVGQSFRIVQRYLDGYNVIRASSVSQVERVVQKIGRFGVLMTSSKDITEWTRLGLDESKGAGVPVVFCPLHTSAEAGEELGAADYLVKPVTREQLQASLNRLPHKPRRILIVDDDPEMLRLFSRLLRSISRRVRVLTAHNGLDGLKLMREQKPDLLLLDLLMPGLTGYDVLEKMRADEALSEIPVIIVSAKGRGEERIVAREIRLARSAGLTVGEAMGCLKAGLDILFRSPAATSEES